ncbi:Myb-like DNA-binding domain containing protein [Trichomonas vaginalis G3]|uniref:Myb-like DNA-binding domain containing protein n=1 Tax=Trichomonas vaginalis (strain ATCC PRA-98 / G3) TaxID=412133 RepID=A2D8W6_TRIV3|nr:RNA polymerase II transcription regulator recruiting protein [Trichomonas vaginalis G3]EAY22992.1 Myb-like DNA-binding domain containing protein [Trichomonas vaginalis G3]KAI5518954.1 RNA polymerase II transcription regulator recruiting protein [Trichomonas vaginalis G3]|eukprot:XP_001583978.1 Myb-like DNA-binding domain containing protein [Trichomonas vaginalis G3]
MSQCDSQKIKLKRNVFTPEEDVHLQSLVQIYSTDWKTISSIMGTRSPRQCRERYLNYLAPGLANDKWTPQEDQLLIEKQKLFGKKWIHIAKFFPHRSSANIKNRWSQLVSKGVAIAQQFHLIPKKHQEESEPESEKTIYAISEVDPSRNTQKPAFHGFSLPSIHEFVRDNGISNFLNINFLKSSMFPSEGLVVNQ